MKNRVLAMATALPALTLVGCGGAPSNSDIKAAMEREVANLSIDMQIKIDKVEQLNCEGAGKSYACDVSVTGSSVYLPKPVTSTRRLRLAKGSDGWLVLR